MPSVLLHSLTFYADLIRRLALRPLNPDIIEIGSETGEMSVVLADAAAERGGRLRVVEPFPSPLLKSLAEARQNVDIVAGFSPDALASTPPAGLYVVDGDHNYVTVTGELEAIFDGPGSADALAIMHDVGWPCGQRDSYYAP